MDSKTASFGSIVAIIGAILIGCGVAWLIADNWHQMPSAVKILVLFIVTAGSLFAGVVLREKQYPGIGHALFILGALLYTLSIFLIAQIFSTSTSLQGFSWLLLLAWIGVVALGYIFVVDGVLLVALIEILVWVIMQFAAFAERGQGFPFGILALCFLAIGILFYGLSLAHRGHTFERIYHYFTALYLLLFAFILSFQLIIPELWRYAQGASSIIGFLVAIAALAVVSLVIGVRAKSWDRKELLGVGAIVLLLATVILISMLPGTVAQQREESGYCSIKSCYSLSKDACVNSTAMQCEWDGNGCVQKTCYMYNTNDACVAKQGCWWVVQQTTTTEQRCDSNGCTAGQNNQQNYTRCEPAVAQVATPQDYQACYLLRSKSDCENNAVCGWSTGYSGGTGKMLVFSPLWFVWVWANIVLLVTILAIIFYGTWAKQPTLINLGMLFFGLMIFSRYVGFIIDLNGYTSLSVLFIIGGILLIGGGYALEKWRRRLVSETKPQPAEQPKGSL